MSQTHRRSHRRPWRQEDGFTLAEVVIALGILAVGIVGLLSSMVFGISGIESARASTNALFLAERRMEQVKSFARSRHPAQGWANLTTASFAAEGHNEIPGYPGYRRTVTITPDPGGAPYTKLVEVRVYYRPVTPAGMVNESAAVVSTLLVWKK